MLRMPHARVAVVLAAGMGLRLRGVQADAPKGLLAFDGEPILARSLRLLAEQGVARVVLVVGYRRDAYARFAAGRPGLELVENPDFATTGAMASLARALPRVDEDFLLLESDIVYERRALASLLGHPGADVILGSGPTGAGDEVWLEAPGGTLVGMSKDRTALASVAGELVGITRVSAALGRVLGEVFDRFVAAHGHARMAYDTEALVAAGRTRPIAVHVVPDLLWGEIDDDRHFRRIRDEVWPALRRREAGAAGGGR
jgi:2-aminoethylphosphonate-pyruvate transaminase